MKKLLLLWALLPAWTVAQNNNNNTSDVNICIGTEISVTIGGALLHNIMVYLPPSYYDTSLQPAKYPVVYLLDGETNFNYFSTLMEKLSQGIPNVPEMIVIGVKNHNREADFVTNTTDFWYFMSELRSIINTEYRCNGFNILVGHSLGGLAVAEAITLHTELFNAYIAHDPSLWWGDNNGLKWFENARNKDFGGRLLYVSYSGEKVRNNGRSRHRGAIESLQKLLSQGGCKNLQSYFQEYPDENHGTVQVVANIDFMRKLFAEMFIDRNDIEANPAIITQRYEAMSKRLGHTFTPSEKYLKNTAKWLQKNGKEKEAKQVLIMVNG